MTSCLGQGLDFTQQLSDRGREAEVVLRHGLLVVEEENGLGAAHRDPVEFVIEGHGPEAGQARSRSSTMGCRRRSGLRRL